MIVLGWYKVPPFAVERDGSVVTVTINRGELPKGRIYEGQSNVVVEIGNEPPKVVTILKVLQYQVHDIPKKLSCLKFQYVDVTIPNLNSEMKPTTGVCIPYKTILAVQLFGPFGDKTIPEIANWIKQYSPEYSYNGVCYVYQQIYAITKTIIKDANATPIITSVIVAYSSFSIPSIEDVELACGAVVEHIQSNGGHVKYGE